MTSTTLLSLEEPSLMVSTFTAVMGRACANTTGWYFTNIANKIDQRCVMCEINFPDASGIVAIWYALDYADLLDTNGERFYRLCERVEREMTEQRVEALSGWDGTPKIERGPRLKVAP